VITGPARTILGFSLVGCLALCDRLFKMAIEHSYFLEKRLGWRFFGIEQFHNPGVAFGIPIPLWLVLPLTIFFLIGLFIWTKKANSTKAAIACTAIFLGALSNAFDRVTYGYTIDYLRIANAIINVADLLILGGIIYLALQSQSRKN